MFTLGIGFGQATNAMVGNELGTEQPQRARRLAFQSVSFTVDCPYIVGSVGLFLYWEDKLPSRVRETFNKGVVYAVVLTEEDATPLVMIW